MLRITLDERERGLLTMRVEGKLQGAWLEELRRCWRETLVYADEQLVVDLTSVTSLSMEAQGLLREMYRAGVRLRGKGLLTGYLIQQIEQEQTA